MTARFRTLALVVPTLRARAGFFGRRVRGERVMSADEIEAHTALLATVPAAVSAWSEANATLDPFEVRVDWERATGSWRPWYRDLMTGTVGQAPGEQPALRGLTPERWARRANPRP